MILPFAPFGPCPSDAVSLDEAVQVVAGTENADPFDPRSYIELDTPLDDVHTQLLAWLDAGELIAFLPLAEGSTCCRVPREYFLRHSGWHEVWDENVGRFVPSRIIRTMLPTINEHYCKVPPGVNNLNWFVSRADLQRLMPKGANKVGRRGPKERYNWSAFHANAVEKLDHEGDFNEGWTLADLESHMTAWCDRLGENTERGHDIQAREYRARQFSRRAGRYLINHLPLT